MMWADPLRDAQDEAPAEYCPRCGGEMWPEEVTYNWEGRGFICPDCLRMLCPTCWSRTPGLWRWRWVWTIRRYK